MNINVNGRSGERAIPLIAFDLVAVSRVTGLTRSQLVRWDRSGFLSPTFADPNRRRPGSRIYSKDDVVALGIVARLRQAGVPLSEIKPVLPRLAPDDSGAWTAPAIHVVGGRMFFSRHDAVQALGPSDRATTMQTIDLASVLAEIEGAIGRLSERLPEEIGQVVRRRGVMQGVPIIAGTPIPTETIVWFHDHGYSLAEILENFPRLTPKDVEAAVAFENQGEGKPLAPLMTHARGWFLDE